VTKNRGASSDLNGITNRGGKGRRAKIKIRKDFWRKLLADRTPSSERVGNGKKNLRPHELFLKNAQRGTPGFLEKGHRGLEPQKKIGQEVQFEKGGKSKDTGIGWRRRFRAVKDVLEKKLKDA